MLLCKKKEKKKRCCLLILCFWTCGISISLTLFMCCRPDLCPPIKVICGLEGNCNGKNKSAQQSTLCLVIALFCFSFLLQPKGCCWQHLLNDTGRGLNNKSSSSESNLGHSSLIVARITETKLNLWWNRRFCLRFYFKVFILFPVLLKIPSILWWLHHCII